MLITRRPSSTAQACCTPSMQTSSSRAFDALVHSMINGYPAAAAAAVAARALPRVNAWEDTDHYFVEAELPGLSIEDVEISIADNQLVIQGERKVSATGESAYVRRERPIGKFTRSLRIPTEIDGDKVGATLKNGVLTVTLPKAATTKPRKISVTPA